MPPALQSLLDRVGGLRRVMIIGTGLAVAGLILLASRWATAPKYVPAFQNVPMENVAKITDALTQAAIPFKLERSGSDILVTDVDFAKARVLLAKGDLLPGDGASSRPDFKLFDTQAWGRTEMEQKIAYRRALEGELEKTISGMSGMTRARVSLALNEAASFRQQQKPPTASVVLYAKSGKAPGADVVQGIQHLVASSVGGIEVNNVSVLESGGRLLTQPEDGSAAGLSSRQMTVKQEIEKELEKKARDMVENIVVTANLNFDKVARTTQSVDPDKQAVSVEQTAEITPGTEGGAGSTQKATSYETTKAVETYEAAVGGIKSLSVAVLVNDRPAPPIVAAPAAPAKNDSTKTDSTKAKKDSTAVATATVVGPTPRTPEELAKIEALVRTAVGADSARGDKVTVINESFGGLPVEPPTEKVTVWQTIEKFERPAVSVIGLVLAAVVGLVAVRSLRPPAPPMPALASIGGRVAGALPLPAGSAAGAAGTAPAALAPPPPTGEGAVLIAKSAPRFEVQVGNTVLRDQTVAVVEQSPDDAARLMRVWLREG
jgi:flagellar M-ring protein FliF